jgi:hypothetical protein
MPTGQGWSRPFSAHLTDPSMTPSTPPSDWPPVSTSGRITYRTATPEDATELAPKLRQSDIAEMALSTSAVISPEVSK